jgi:hypothetical protein
VITNSTCQHRFLVTSVIFVCSDERRIHDLERCTVTHAYIALRTARFNLHYPTKAQHLQLSPFPPIYHENSDRRKHAVACWKTGLKLRAGFLILSHCYVDSRKGDSHWVHNSDPTRTCSYICLPLPQPVVTPPTPTGHCPSHWLRHIPTATPSGINTPHFPSQSFFIHLPMKMKPIEGSETSAIITKKPENYPK